MKTKNNFIFWLPRIILILLILFISIFSFDVFEGNNTIIEKLIDLFMHLIPTLILIILLVIAWKKPFIGFILLIITGTFSIFFFNINKNPYVILILILPQYIIGLLFLLDYKYNSKKSKKIKKKPKNKRKK